jgi:beta-lactam-binding protein with PASTA domain
MGCWAHHLLVSDGTPEVREQVVTPDVVGMVVDDARRVAQAAGVVLAQPDPDGPPLGALTWQLPVCVTSQNPTPGTVLNRWESVVVTWNSDEAGVREPRRPTPRSMSASEPVDHEDPPGQP